MITQQVQAWEAEILLNQLKVQYRLCHMLRPSFTPGDEDDNAIQGVICTAPVLFSAGTSLHQLHSIVKLVLGRFCQHTFGVLQMLDQGCATFLTPQSTC